MEQSAFFAKTIMSYNEIVYDDGDSYKGEWSADGKVMHLNMKR